MAIKNEVVDKIEVDWTGDGYDSYGPGCHVTVSITGLDEAFEGMPEDREECLREIAKVIERHTEADWAHTEAELKEFEAEADKEGLL